MSNLLKRVLAGAVGIPLILAVSYYGGILFFVFAAVINAIALWEFYSMVEKKDIHPLKYTAIFFSLMVMIGFLELQGSELFLYSFLICSVIIFSVIEIFRGGKRNPVNVMIVLFGYLYITLPMIFLVALSELSKNSGLNILILIFVLIWTCDTAAYFGGRAFGKHQLSGISPKKTWEGAVAGFVFTVIVSLLVHFIFPEKLILKDAVIIGFIVGIFSQIGDLFESLIKRHCDVKDSSDIIPGHGGVLDRFDSLIFVAPVIFLYELLRQHL
ncbi:MAG: phosphatidate cytidylyltransferase [Ignavibacteria bacterium]